MFSALTAWTNINMLEYIYEETVWQKLKSESRPILLYGMGNGADMIIEKLNSFGIEYKDVYASDEFVRGHHFHGKKVLKYSEAEEKYGDFVSLMTFAVKDDTTINRVYEMSRKHPLYSLTVPVAGDGLFTKEFVKENEEKFNKAFSLLADDKSRETYINLLNFKISGKLEYLIPSFSEKNEVYENILKINESEVIADLGAYNGDTVEEFVLASGGGVKKIYALEPDRKNFAKLVRNTEKYDFVESFNVAAYKEDTVLKFKKAAGRQSKISDDGEEIQAAKIDTLIKEKISLLKMDIEGSEIDAIKGAENTIRTQKPKLYICAYHRNEDMFSIPLAINEIRDDYKFYFRQHKYIPAWESNFYAL
ncbi:MAG: FkbM family methyltransferase [Clostridia bacterium]|nr:FkbM family methyltransferase [Clostridia bacterium]